MSDHQLNTSMLAEMLAKRAVVNRWLPAVKQASMGDWLKMPSGMGEGPATQKPLTQETIDRFEQLAQPSLGQDIWNAAGHGLNWLWGGPTDLAMPAGVAATVADRNWNWLRGNDAGALSRGADAIAKEPPIHMMNSMAGGKGGGKGGVKGKLDPHWMSVLKRVNQSKDVARATLQERRLASLPSWLQNVAGRLQNRPNVAPITPAEINNSHLKDILRAGKALPKDTGTLKRLMSNAGRPLLTFGLPFLGVKLLNDLRQGWQNQEQARQLAEQYLQKRQ